MKQNIRIFKLYLQILLHYFFWIQKKEFIAILYPSTCLNIRLIFIDIFKKKRRKTRMYRSHVHPNHSLRSWNRESILNAVNLSTKMYIIRMRTERELLLAEEKKKKKIIITWTFFFRETPPLSLAAFSLEIIITLESNEALVNESIIIDCLVLPCVSRSFVLLIPCMTRVPVSKKHTSSWKTSSTKLVD